MLHVMTVIFVFFYFFFRSVACLAGSFSYYVACLLDTNVIVAVGCRLDLHSLVVPVSSPKQNLRWTTLSLWRRADRTTLEPVSGWPQQPMAVVASVPSVFKLLHPC